MLKNQKGITLIALVITIIVLLILAGVSIAMLSGDNGILNQAATAKEDTAKAEAEERINMELNALYAAILASDTKTTFTDNEIKNVKVNLGIEDAAGTTISNAKYALEKTTATGGDKVTISTTIAGVENGIIEVTGAGKAKLTPAKATLAD